MSRIGDGRSRRGGAPAGSDREGGPTPSGRGGERDGVQLRAPTSLLARASTELAAALALDEALRALASIVVPAAADWYVVDLVTEDGEIRRVAIEHEDPARVEQVRALEERYPPDPDAPQGSRHVIRTGRSELVTTLTDDVLESAARDDEHLALLRELGLSSYVIAPLIARGRTLGAMTFVYAESGREYDEDARLFIEDLAGRAALALDNIRLLDDVKAARHQLEQQAQALERTNEELAVQNEKLQTKAAELAEALERAEEEHREKAALLASAADGIYGIDGEGRCTFMNAAAARMLRMDPAEADGRDMHRLIHHTRRDGQPYPPEDCPILQAFSRGESVRVDDEVLWRGDGTWFTASYSSSPVIRDGAVVGAVVAFADETSRRSAEGRIQLLGRILDESLNEIYMFDAESLRFVQVNRGGRQNLGYSMDEMREMTPLDLKPEFSQESFVTLVEPLRTGDEPAVRFETVHRRKDGSTYPVEVNLQLSHGGERPLFVAVILDISRRREAEEERERLIRELEHANRIKAEFVSTMSHELRTPLNAVLGYAQLLEDGIPVSVPEEARSHVRRIHLSGRHLLQLIDEILTFSKLEAGRESANPSPIQLPELVEEVQAVLRPLADEKAIRFDVTVGEATEPFVSDPKKLRQILLNLAGNAVKFTDEGAVELTVRPEGDAVVFEVSDTGPGMSAEERGMAFEPFWQADQSSTREVGGTGLGLAITQRFVDILGGSLRLESDTGKGTTFTVVLPSLRSSNAADGGHG